MRLGRWTGLLVVLTMLVGAPSATAVGWVTMVGTPTVPGSDVISTPQSLAIDGSGDLWLAFAEQSGGVATTVHAFERAPGGSFVSELSLPRQAFPPLVAAGPNGTVAVAWVTLTSGNGKPELVIKPPGGSFGAPIQGPVGSESILVGLAVLPDGTVLFAWDDDTAPFLHVESFAPGSTTPVDETPTGIASIPTEITMVTNATGEAVLAWVDNPASNVSRIGFSERPPGGTFGATQALAQRTTKAGETSQGFAGHSSLWTMRATFSPPTI